MSQAKQLFALSILVVLYTLGMVGSLAYGTDILALSPITLLLATFIIGLFHRPLDARFVAYCFTVFVGGFVLGAVGANTGSLFGWFFYGNNLGVKIFDTPLVIGLHWLLLCYCSSVWVSTLAKRFMAFNSTIAKALMASLVMVAIDVLVEQVAPACDFWYWKNQLVPLQNYTAWFAFSFAFNYLFQRLDIDTNNPLAKWLLGLKVVFFLTLNLFL
jgi:putative membrane protein